jgi:hypothetical protein
VKVYGCLSAFAGFEIGAGFLVEWISSGTTVYSATTDSSGVASVTGTAGTYDLRVTDTRGTPRWSALTASGVIFACNTPVAAVMTTPLSGFRCGGFCPDALKETLYATDANGTWTLTYDASHPSGAGWYGCGTKTSMTGVVTSLSAGACIKTTGTANTSYVIGLSAVGMLVTNLFGRHGSGFPTSSTPSCSGGTLDLNANIPGSCAGAIVQESASTTVSGTCAPLSLTATMPSFGSVGNPNPGAGSITITE